MSSGMQPNRPQGKPRRSRRPSRSLLRTVDPFLVGFAAFLAIGLLVYGMLAIVDRYRPRHLIFAAGGKTGESYLIARAFAEVVQRRLPVTVDVISTGGTDANLRLLGLDDPQLCAQLNTSGTAGCADLAVAQADILNDYSDDISTLGAQALSTLFVDKFQLLTCHAEDVGFDQVLRDLSNGVMVNGTPHKPRVYVPLNGGQKDSFDRMAGHFGFEPGDQYSVPPEDQLYTNPANGTRDLIPCEPSQYGNMIFRVRIAGNQEIATALKRGWQLVELQEIGAMQLQNTALIKDSIPAGTYRVNLLPLPAEDLDTIAVQRLLLARRDHGGFLGLFSGMPAWLVEELTRALNEDSQAMADILLPPTGDGRPQRPGKPLEDAGLANFEDIAYVQNYVVPLLPRIPVLNTPERLAELGVALHPGARQYFKPNESWFAWINEHADGIGFVFSLFGIIYTSVIAANGLLQRSRKNYADIYLNNASFLKNSTILTRQASGTQRLANAPPGNLTVEEERIKARLESAVNSSKSDPKFTALLNGGILEELTLSLIEGACKIGLLSDVFRDASHALEREDISEESFRTFNEAYSAARQSIENHMEEDRRQLVLYYVNQVMSLIEPPVELELNRMRLETILIEASRVLRNDLIFSRESFRTFSEAYNLAQNGLS